MRDKLKKSYIYKDFYKVLIENLEEAVAVKIWTSANTSYAKSLEKWPEIGHDSRHYDKNKK